MTTFQEGDTVRISKSSEYYGKDFKYSLSNPSDIDGTITSVSYVVTDRLRVNWDNGEWNTYYSTDLKLRKRV